MQRSASKILSARLTTTAPLSTLLTNPIFVPAAAPPPSSSRSPHATNHHVGPSAIKRALSTRQNASGRFGRYIEDYTESLTDCGRAYWLRASSELDWHTPPTLENTLLNHPAHENMHEWFADGIMNTSYNCLDRHVNEGRGDSIALVHDSPVTDTKRIYTYSELLDEVSRFAYALSDLGVERGDRVVIYMPMIPEAVIGMLACARIGAVHSVVFGGFAAKELASRIDDSKPKAILSASGGVLPGGRTVAYKPLLDKALDIAKWKGVKRSVIVQREGVLECSLREGTDVSYRELMDGVNEKMDAVPVPSTHVS